MYAMRLAILTWILVPKVEISSVLAWTIAYIGVCISGIVYMDRNAPWPVGLLKQICQPRHKMSIHVYCRLRAVPTFRGFRFPGMRKES
jgi:hypothetical protein